MFTSMKNSPKFIKSCSIASRAGVIFKNTPQPIKSTNRKYSTPGYFGKSRNVREYSVSKANASVSVSANNTNKSFPLNENYYTGKSVLITGGGTGLGKSMADQFYNLGANVIICSRNESVLNATAKELTNASNSNKIIYKQLDVRDSAKVQELNDWLYDNALFPDIVINNAAANFLAKSETLTPNAWNTIIDIVLRGTINMTSVFGKKMIETGREGTFINISTTYADTGSAFVVPSGVAKAGCNNLIRSLASEWGSYRIRFVGVAPGPIYTDGAFSRIDPDGRLTEDLVKRLPLGRLPTKSEFAHFISYLASDYAKPINGEIINYDGGETALNRGEFNSLLSLSNDDWDSFHSKL
jgi:2,4-dienoyl-CoA reductase [(3E)-enoyl-CoA-producing], mitochondrial